MESSHYPRVLIPESQKHQQQEKKNPRCVILLPLFSSRTTSRIQDTRNIATASSSQVMPLEYDRKGRSNIQIDSSSINKEKKNLRYQCLPRPKADLRDHYDRNYFFLSPNKRAESGTSRVNGKPRSKSSSSTSTHPPRIQLVRVKTRTNTSAFIQVLLHFSTSGTGDW